MDHVILRIMATGGHCPSRANDEAWIGSHASITHLQKQFPLPQPQSRGAWMTIFSFLHTPVAQFGTLPSLLLDSVRSSCRFPCTSTMRGPFPSQALQWTMHSCAVHLLDHSQRARTLVCRFYWRAWLRRYVLLRLFPSLRLLRVNSSTRASSAH